MICYISASLAAIGEQGLLFFSTLCYETNVCLILYKTARGYIIRSVLYTDHLHHGSLDPHCSVGRLCSLPASLENWQATKGSPTGPTNTAVDWQPSPGRLGKLALLPCHG